MSTASTKETLSFELPNVGVGPDPLSLAEIAAVSDFAVLLFLRDYHCPKCKAQVASISEEAEQFNDLATAILPILPEPPERAADWRDGFDREFPFPLLADGDKEVAKQYDQPTRFGAVGSLHDLIGRLPQSVILDTRDGDPEVIYTYEGDSVSDRPEVEELLDQVHELQETFAFDCSLVDC